MLWSTSLNKDSIRFSRCKDLLWPVILDRQLGQVNPPDRHFIFHWSMQYLQYTWPQFNVCGWKRENISYHQSTWTKNSDPENGQVRYSDPHIKVGTAANLPIQIKCVCVKSEGGRGRWETGIVKANHLITGHSCSHMQADDMTLSSKNLSQALHPVTWYNYNWIQISIDRLMWIRILYK